MDSREFSEWIAYYGIEPWGLPDMLIRGWTDGRRRKTPREMWAIVKAAAGAARAAKGKHSGDGTAH